MPSGVDFLVSVMRLDADFGVSIAMVRAARLDMRRQEETAMNSANSTACVVVVGCVQLLSASGVSGQDWPQWRGLNRDARVTGFNVPKMWPKELTQKWKVTVGDGVATPALVGDKLYVFSLQDGNETLRCLDASTGKEIWADKYPTQGADGPARSFAGPRSSPTVADRKVVTLGVRGTLSCLDAATGKVFWRNDDFKGRSPRFYTSNSPIIVDGLCIVQLGGESNGAIVAYDLATGKEKWKWADDGTAYASPVLLTIDGVRSIVAETATNIVAVSVADGKLLWKTPFAVQGRGYNACTPVVEGQTVVFSGSSRGTRAVKLEKRGAEIVGKELWTNSEHSVQFNTPVLKNGLVFGLSERDVLFCIDSQTGKTAWTAPAPKGTGSGGGGRGRAGYGSIVDVGGVLLALTPSAQLVVFEPNDKEFKQIASYRLADGDTYAYPVVSGNRVFVKDREAVTLWRME
jgi:outer membrane protein assembly factor BamB